MKSKVKILVEMLSAKKEFTVWHINNEFTIIIDKHYSLAFNTFIKNSKNYSLYIDDK